MEMRKVVNWIGVIALALGTFISVVRGGWISALLGSLFISLLVSSMLPLPTKLASRVSMRWMLLHKIVMRTVALVGCWVLAGVGGWEFVPAAVVLTVSLLIWPGVSLFMKRRSNNSLVNGNDRVYPMMSIANDKNTITTTSTSESDTVAVNTAISDTQSPPPVYTSTVKIIQEDCKPQPEIAQCPVLQTPVFNV